jgi:hypothetical protein
LLESGVLTHNVPHQDAAVHAGRLWPRRHHIAQALHNLGIVERSRKRWPEAAAQLRESAAMDLDDRIWALASVAIGPEAHNTRETLHDLVEALWHMSLGAPAAPHHSRRWIAEFP